MLYITVKSTEKEEIQEYLLEELAKVFLTVLVQELTEDNLDKAVNVLKEHALKKSKGKQIKVNIEYEDIMFFIEDAITGRMRYHDGYAFSKEATVDYALERVKLKYPEVQIEGEFFIQSGTIGMYYQVKTEGNHVVTLKTTE